MSEMFYLKHLHLVGFFKDRSMYESVSSWHATLFLQVRTLKNVHLLTDQSLEDQSKTKGMCFCSVYCTSPCMIAG